METLQITIAVLTLLVSIIAIIYTAKSLRHTEKSLLYTSESLQIQREHNYKSVKPIASIDLGDYENDIYVKITNNGIGPMIIKEASMSKGDIKSENLIELLPETIKYNVTWDTFSSDIRQHSIKVDGCIYWLRKKFDVTDQNDSNLRRALREELKKITIKVQYTDIYEKNHYEIERDLKWFERALAKKKLISKLE